MNHPIALLIQWNEVAERMSVMVPDGKPMRGEPTYW